MIKTEFLLELRKHLKKLPQDEREAAVADYEEHFEHGIFKGRSEDEITRSLGNPKKIAIELVTDYYLEQAQQTHSYTSLSRAVFASLGLGFLNLVFVLGPFIVISVFIVAFYVVAFALILTPLAVIFSLFSGNGVAQSILHGFASLALAGLGLAIGTGNTYFAKSFFGWFARYIKSNLRIIRGEVK
jgi:uncharacterized membrane protein